MPDDLITRVRARASNPETIHDMVQGLSPAPRIHPKAMSEQIAATEAALGFSLPLLLRQILAEVGNGGFGPGYGLIGVQGGYADFSLGHLDQVYRVFRQTDPDDKLPQWPEGLLPFCNWGCGIYSCLDCGKAEAPVFVYYPDMHVLDHLERTKITLTDAEGNVVWTHSPPEESSLPEVGQHVTSRGFPLIWHKASFREWVSAWVDGVDLWQDMERRF